MIRPADNGKDPGCGFLYQLKFVKLVPCHERGKQKLG